MKLIAAVISLFLLGGCSNQHSEVLQGYVEGEYTHLAPLFAGKLKKRYVDRGQTVVAGQPIFDLDIEPENSELQKALFDLESEKSKLRDYLAGQRTTVLEGIISQREQAQADLSYSQQQFKRIAELFKKDVVSKSSYDEALAKYQSDQQKVNQYEQNLKEAELGERQYRILQQSQVVKSAEAQVQEAKWRLAQKSVTAPEGGYIFDTYFNDGEEVAANQVVVALLAPRYITLVFFIPEPLRGGLKLNQQINFVCSGCSESYTAKINYISPQAEYTPPVIFSRESRDKLVYLVRGALPLEVAQKVHPGQPVDVTVTIQSSENHNSLGRRLWKKLTR